MVLAVGVTVVEKVSVMGMVWVTVVVVDTGSVIVFVEDVICVVGIVVVFETVDVVVAVAQQVDLVEVVVTVSVLVLVAST